MIKCANGREFCMLGFVSVKELKEEQRMAIKAFVNGRDVFVCLLTGFGKSLCYASLPMEVFDILNGQHEHELGTFTFSPVSDSRLLRSLLVLGRSLLQSKHFSSDFDIFAQINSYVT